MDISLVLLEGGFNIGEHYQIVGIWGVDTWANVLRWYHPSVPYPSESALVAWQTAAQTKLDATSALGIARNGLKEKVSLAITYKAEIATLWNVCLEQLETNASHPTRFNNVLAAVNALPTALKNRVNKGTADPTLASTDALKDAYLDHVLLVAGNLATLLSFG